MVTLNPCHLTRWSTRVNQLRCRLGYLFRADRFTMSQLSPWKSPFSRLILRFQKSTYKQLSSVPSQVYIHRGGICNAQLGLEHWNLVLSRASRDENSPVLESGELGTHNDSTRSVYFSPICINSLVSFCDLLSELLSAILDQIQRLQAWST